VLTALLGKAQGECKTSCQMLALCKG
jgi:hypothetical protein